ISEKIVGGIPCRRRASTRPPCHGPRPDYPHPGDHPTMFSASPAALHRRTTARGPRMTTTDTSLAADIDATCRLTGEFTLRSGQVSDEYFDKYLFEADPLLLARVAREMVQLLPHDTDLLGGLDLGGV